MDNALQKLREIGIEKIKEDTNLDITKIECILNKRFEKLDSVRAKGFVNILEKQYNLDLSFWLLEYKDFHQGNKKDEPKIQESGVESKNSFLIWGAVALIGVIGAVLLALLIPSDSKASKKEIASASIEEKIPQTSQDTAIKEEVEILQEQKEQNNQNDLPKAVESKEITQNKQEVSSDKKISEYGEVIFPNLSFDEENILYIESDKPLWVGIINIDSKKRIAKTKKDFEIPLDKQLLISIARGGFALSFDDESKEFKGYLPVYLIHTKEGGLREISKEEFIYLNGGVEW